MIVYRPKLLSIVALYCVFSMSNLLCLTRAEVKKMVADAQAIIKHDPLTQADQESVQATIAKLKSKSATMRSGESLQNQLALRLTEQSSRKKALDEVRSHFTVLFDALGVKNADDALASVQRLKATSRDSAQVSEAMDRKQAEIDLLAQQLQEQKRLNKDLQESSKRHLETIESHAQEAYGKSQDVVELQQQLAKKQDELEQLRDTVKKSKEVIQRKESEIAQTKEAAEKKLQSCQAALDTAQKKYTDAARKDQELTDLRKKLQEVQSAHSNLDAEHSQAKTDHEKTLDAQQKEHVQAAQRHSIEQEEKNKKIQDLQEKITQYKKTNEELKSENTKLGKEQSTMKSRAEQCSQENARQKTEIERLKRELQTKQSEHAILQQARQKQQKEHADAIEGHKQAAQAHKDDLRAKEKEHTQALASAEQKHKDATKAHEKVISEHQKTVKKQSHDLDNCKKSLNETKKANDVLHKEAATAREGEEQCAEESRKKDLMIKKLEKLIQYPQMPELTEIAVGKDNYTQLINAAKSIDNSKDRFKDIKTVGNVAKTAVLAAIDVDKMPENSKAREQLAKKIEECKPKVVGGAMGGTMAGSMQQTLSSAISEECKADKIKVTRLKILGNFFAAWSNKGNERYKVFDDYMMPILQNKKWSNSLTVAAKTLQALSSDSKGSNLTFPVTKNEYEQAEKAVK